MGACAAVALGLIAAQGVMAFLLPTGAASQTPRESQHATLATAATSSPLPASSSESYASWGLAAMGMTIGAHAGLLVALRGRDSVAMRAEAKAKKKEKEAAGGYVESAADQRLFEQVYMEYTAEYLKGPLYWHQEKLQGMSHFGYAGNPMTKNGKLTSNMVGNLKTFGSNELAYLSILFFAIGLYGNLQFQYFDPQFPKVAQGENFNVSYIVESLLLPISFFMHIACAIQKANGK